MNKSETKAEVEEFLGEMRELIGQDRVLLVPREPNLFWIEELEITVEQLWNIIERLTINNYHRGPEEDRDRGATFLWKFGRTIERRETYIKLKIDTSSRGRILKCLSFHEAQFTLDYPLRPQPHQREK